MIYFIPTQLIRMFFYYMTALRITRGPRGYNRHPRITNVRVSTCSYPLKKQQQQTKQKQNTTKKKKEKKIQSLTILLAFGLKFMGKEWSMLSLHARVFCKKNTPKSYMYTVF